MKLVDSLFIFHFSFIKINFIAFIYIGGCFEQLKATDIKEIFKTMLTKEIVPIEIRANQLRLFQTFVDRGKLFFSLKFFRLLL